MGMTLDEAIKHAEEVAEENEKSLRGWKKCINRGIVGWLDFVKEKVNTSITRCSKCAAEHRQLVVWLKDYKRLLERESCKDVISRETVKTEYKRRLESSLKDESKGIDLTHLSDCTRFNEFIDSIPPVNSQHCEDVVSRKEVAEFLRNYAKDFEDTRVRMAFMAASSLVENTNNVPSVTPAHIEQKPKTGHWIFTETKLDRHGCTAECSSCHKKWKTYDEIRFKKEHNYCPKCGAKMAESEG